MSDIDAINALRDGFLAAFNAGDIDQSLTFLTADPVGMPPGKAPMVGEDGHRADWGTSFAAGKSVFEFTPVEIEIEGDMAFDRFDWAVTFTPAGSNEPVVDGGNCLWINKRQPDGSWKVHRAIWNSTRDAGSPWLETD